MRIKRLRRFGYWLLAIGDRQAIEKDEGDLVFFLCLGNRESRVGNPADRESDLYWISK